MANPKRVFNFIKQLSMKRTKTSNAACNDSVATESLHSGYYGTATDAAHSRAWQPCDNACASFQSNSTTSSLSGLPEGYIDEATGSRPAEQHCPAAPALLQQQVTERSPAPTSTPTSESPAAVSRQPAASCQYDPIAMRSRGSTAATADNLVVEVLSSISSEERFLLHMCGMALPHRNFMLRETSTEQTPRPGNGMLEAEPRMEAELCKTAQQCDDIAG